MSSGLVFWHSKTFLEFGVEPAVTEDPSPACRRTRSADAVLQRWFGGSCAEESAARLEAASHFELSAAESAASMGLLPADRPWLKAGGEEGRDSSSDDELDAPRGSPWLKAEAEADEGGFSTDDEELLGLPAVDAPWLQAWQTTAHHLTAESSPSSSFNVLHEVRVASARGALSDSTADTGGSFDVLCEESRGSFTPTSSLHSKLHIFDPPATVVGRTQRQVQVVEKARKPPAEQTESRESFTPTSSIQSKLHSFEPSAAVCGRTEPQAKLMEEHSEPPSEQAACDLRIMLKNIGCRCTVEQLRGHLDRLGLAGIYRNLCVPSRGDTGQRRGNVAVATNKGFAFIGFWTAADLEYATSVLHGREVVFASSSRRLEVAPALMPSRKVRSGRDAPHRPAAHGR